MKITPQKITSLQPNEIFVFGSNYAGIHGRGAAKDALKFGAKYGTGMGLCGQTYGIATKDHHLRVLPLAAIATQVERFYRHAGNNTQNQFLVTPIGCGLAGYNPKQIGPMFADPPPNVSLPQSFWGALV